MPAVKHPARPLFILMALFGIGALAAMAVQLNARAIPNGVSEGHCNMVFGYVFNDVNGNASYNNPPDMPIQGSTLKIYGGPGFSMFLGQTISASTGYYEFNGLGVGPYRVVQTNLPAYTGNTTPNTVDIDFPMCESDSDFIFKGTSARGLTAAGPLLQVDFGDTLPPPVTTQGTPGIVTTTPTTPAATPTTPAATPTTPAATPTTPAATPTTPAATASPTTPAATSTPQTTPSTGGVIGTTPSTGAVAATPKAPSAGNGLTGDPANPLLWVVVLLGASILCGTAGASVIAAGYRRK